MKLREFNKHLNACRNKQKTLVDPDKLAALPEDVRMQMVYFIVRQRAPILTVLLTPQIDRDWLACCAYWHTTTSPTTGLTFLHTSEHHIR